MKSPIFYFDKFNTFDKWVIGLYLVISAGLFYYFASTDNIANKRIIVFAYPLITQLILYCLLYISLRNLSVFTVWLAIGLFHLFLFFILKDDITLHMIGGYSTKSLRNTLPLLFVYQLLRIISLKTQGKELVGPSRGSTTDIFDEREVTWLDFVFFFSYLGCMIVLD